jgi:hypothetical protein
MISRIVCFGLILFVAPVVLTRTAAAQTSTSAVSSESVSDDQAVGEQVFEDLVLVKKAFWRASRTGRLVLRGDTLSWEAAGHPDDNFTFQIAGIDKVWFTCDARPSGNFCHEINFQIVRGDSYRFRDSGRDSGANAAVLAVMEMLRSNFPRLNFATPDVND